VSVDKAKQITVLGGGGFVDARLVQLASDSVEFQALPVLRSFRGLARLGVFVPFSRVIDSKDLDLLIEAFKGSATVVNLTMGDQMRILADTQLVYTPYVKSGVRQHIHLSSAVVFGRVKDHSIHDDPPPNARSWMLYAREKAMAEVWLRNQLSQRQIRLVILRPGLIWGLDQIGLK